MVLGSIIEGVAGHVSRSPLHLYETWLWRHRRSGREKGRWEKRGTGCEGKENEGEREKKGETVGCEGKGR